MTTPSKFIETQYKFAAHIRDPNKNPKPDDVEDRRMAIYRDLFFNNVAGFLESSFPVLKLVIDDIDKNYWNTLARSFYSTHRCQSPLFLEISKEFLQYLEHEHKKTELDPAFMYELAHYEWVELALSIAEDTLDYTKIDPNGDLLKKSPVISPVAWPLAYHFPVHQIGPHFQPKEPGAQTTFLVVYRDRKDQIGFLEINAVTARLLELIAELADQTITGYEILETIAKELGHDDISAIVSAGTKILNDMHAAGVLLGTHH